MIRREFMEALLAVPVPVLLAEKAKRRMEVPRAKIAQLFCDAIGVPVPESPPIPNRDKFPNMSQSERDRYYRKMMQFYTKEKAIYYEEMRLLDRIVDNWAKVMIRDSLESSIEVVIV